MTTATLAPIREESSLDDLRQGHSVIIAARWMLVAAGLMFVLYRQQSVSELTVGVLAILGIAAVNFWLHCRPLTNQPVEPQWAYCASAADLVVISGLVLMQGSQMSKAYAFYYPAILGYSLVFPAAVSAVLTGAVLAFVLVTGSIDGLDFGRAPANAGGHGFHRVAVSEGGRAAPRPPGAGLVHSGRLRVRIGSHRGTGGYFLRTDRVHRRSLVRDRRGHLPGAISRE